MMIISLKRERELVLQFLARSSVPDILAIRLSCERLMRHTL